MTTFLNKSDRRSTLKGILNFLVCFHQLGATCVLKKKFSASQFWNDCRKYNVAVFLYMGELRHYLCNQPTKEEDRVHKVHIALGSSFRPAVSKEFLMRFGPIKIFEFYGSTEGNLSFLNYPNKIGAVGHAGIFSKLLRSFGLLKYNVRKQELKKDENGGCKKLCKLLRMPHFLDTWEIKPQKRNSFIMFVKEDVYFNTGDLLVMDEDVFLYFSDHVADTFGWKGKKIATIEVADIIGMMDFVQEVNVYSIKNYEGRTGMAAVVVKPDQPFNGERLYKYVVDFLPTYAQRCFVRIMDLMQINATFKHQKMQLLNEEFNPGIISEPLYFMHEPAHSYIPLTRDLYKNVTSGEINI
uniref:long-chain-fatty-acid--CoA ligase n=1 Tax=Falco tinnunculus TaxID=100819 RepID=A0A8C4UQL4_FALTI